MLLVIMTRSLIRLGNTVRASLNNDCMTNRHDERQWDDNDDRTDDNTGITKGYNEWNWEDDAMTETDSGITRGYDSITRGYSREREGVGTDINNDDITRGYN